MSLTVRPPTKVRSPWPIAAGIALGVGADVAFDPVHRHVPLCPFKALTGWDCPLCGGLRATDQLAHGHFGAALHANVLLVLALPLIAWFWADAVLRHRSGRPYRHVPRSAAISLVALCVVFTVVRNLPGMRALNPG